MPGRLVRGDGIRMRPLRCIRSMLNMHLETFGFIRFRLSLEASRAPLAGPRWPSMNLGLAPSHAAEPMSSLIGLSFPCGNTRRIGLAAAALPRLPPKMPHDPDPPRRESVT